MRVSKDPVCFVDGLEAGLCLRARVDVWMTLLSGAVIRRPDLVGARPGLDAQTRVISFRVRLGHGGCLIQSPAPLDKSHAPNRKKVSLELKRTVGVRKSVGLACRMVIRRRSFFSPARTDAGRFGCDRRSIRQQLCERQDLLTRQSFLLGQHPRCYSDRCSCS